MLGQPKSQKLFSSKILTSHSPEFIINFICFVVLIIYLSSSSKAFFVLKTKRYIAPENIPIQYGGLKREDDVEFPEGGDKASEMTIRGGGIGTIGIPVTEVLANFHCPLE